MRRILSLSAWLVTALGLACGDSAAPPEGDASQDAGPTLDAGSGEAPLLPDAGPDAVGPTLAPPYFGANVEAGGVVFRVWAPHATAAKVRTPPVSPDVDMTEVAAGVFEAHVPGAHAGDAYAFVLETPSGELLREDPYCRELSKGACVVVDPSQYPWKTGSFASPSRSAAVVYEMHVGSFAVPPNAPSGTFASTRDALDSLADLGVNVIELMPVQDSGSGAMGWGYNPELYFAPKPSLGTLDDLRSLVDRAHALGIAVWIDTVVNHTDGYSQAPLACFDQTCAPGERGIYFFPPGPFATTPWGPRPNYAEPRVATMLLDAVDTWTTELRCDGFRWDSVSNVRALDGNGDVPGGRDLLVAANAHVHARGGSSVAEDLKGYAKITDPPSSGGFGFDAQWDGFGWTVPGQLALASDDARDLGPIEGALTGGYDGDGFARVLFVEDHDTVGNGGSRLPDRIDGANPTSWAARKRSMLGGVLLLTSPGVPMIFQGQEWLATGTFTSPATPLAAPSAQGTMVRAFYRDMLRLRRNLGGGAGGLGDASVEVIQRNDAAKVIAYRRYGASGQDVIVLVNLRNKAYTRYDIGVPDAGPWQVRLNTESSSYGADFGDGQSGSVTATKADKDGKPYTLSLALGAYSAIVLTR